MSLVLMVIVVPLVPLVQRATKAPPAPPVLTVHKEHKAQQARRVLLGWAAVSAPMVQSDSRVQLAQWATREIPGQLDSPAKLAQSVHAETQVHRAKVVRLGLMAKLDKLESEAKLAPLVQLDQLV